MHGGPSELRVSADDADWALAEGREALLRAAASVLTQVLGPDERVRLVSKVFASKGWAWMRNSWRRSGDRLTLVATDRRLLLIHVDGKGRPSLYANQIPYTAIRRLEAGLFGLSVAVETGDGTLKLKGMRRKTHDRLVDIVERNPNASSGVQPLCPTCLGPQASTSGPCTDCGAGCKSARTAALKSLIFPGLGDIYLGQTLVGAAAAIMTAFVWIMLLFVFGMSIREGGWQTSTVLGVALVSGILLVFGHGTSSLVARWRARQARFSEDHRLPSGSAPQSPPTSVAIIPAGDATTEARQALAAAAAKRESALSRFGRPVFAAAAGIGAFLAVVAVLALVDNWAASEVPLQEADYRYVPTIQDLGEWLEDFEPDPDLVLASKTIYTDGTYSIDYEYEDPEGLFFQAGANVERKSADALAVYGGARVAYEAMYAALEEDITLEDADEFFRWGDRSTHVYLTSAGETFGQLFLTQKGRIVFSVTISGVYFDEPEDFEEFILPCLEQIAVLASERHQRPER